MHVRMETWRRLRYSISLWIYFIIITSFTAHVASSTTFMPKDMPEARLVKALTFGKLANVRPAKTYREQTNVTFSFVLLHVRHLNIADQEFKVAGSFIVMWNDPFLTWNPGDFDNISLTHILTSSIWIPSFVITNSLSAGKEDVDEWTKGMVDVHHDGSVVWLPKGVFTMLCNVNVYHFPFDTQTCTLDIIQLSLRESESIYTGRNSSDPLKLKKNEEWIIMNEEIINSKIIGKRGNFSSIVFSYTLKRQPAFYVLTVMVPVLLLFVVGLMVFPLPADSGEKVSLCVACLMSFFIMQLMISQQIPRNWQSIPIIMIFNSVFMMLNALSICVTVLVLNLHHRQPVNDVPKCLERFLDSRWRNWWQKKGNGVVDLTLKVAEDGNHEDENGSRSELVKKDDVTYSMLSSILAEIKKARDDMRNNVNEEELMRMKWRDVADAVNTVLCAVYILAGVVMSSICILLWHQE